MKKLMFCWLLVMGITSTLFAQNNWYVSPTGTPTGNGTQGNPWDLQTALNHPTSVLSGDTIWLLVGTYKGQYTSNLQGTTTSHITVRGVKNSGVVELDGNVIGNPVGSVLTVKKSFVTFRDFEITCKDITTRFVQNSSAVNEETGGTSVIGGINHSNGEDCKFINLIIYNNTTSGVGSWKSTGGTEFYGCVLYNNGSYYLKNNYLTGLGHGFYIQNISQEKRRKIENNIIFNSMNSNTTISSACPSNCIQSAGSDYIKNIDFLNNTTFNSTSPISCYKNYDKVINGVFAAENNPNILTEDFKIRVNYTDEYGFPFCTIYSWIKDENKFSILH